MVEIRAQKILLNKCTSFGEINLMYVIRSHMPVAKWLVMTRSVEDGLSVSRQKDELATTNNVIFS